jgi:hypothetical protein
MVSVSLMGREGELSSMLGCYEARFERSIRIGESSNACSQIGKSIRYDLFSICEISDLRQAPPKWLKGREKSLELLSYVRKIALLGFSHERRTMLVDARDRRMDSAYFLVKARKPLGRSFQLRHHS